MMHRSEPKVKPARAELRAELTIAINGQSYIVRPILGISDVTIIRAWRLSKLDNAGAVYDVAEHEDHNECDCPDYTYRRAGLDRDGCKHCRALRAVGLIDGPAASPACQVVAPPEPEAFDVALDP